MLLSRLEIRFSIAYVISLFDFNMLLIDIFMKTTCSTQAAIVRCNCENYAVHRYVVDNHLASH